MSDCTVPVVYVSKAKAKSVKSGLEEYNLFDNKYKICASLRKEGMEEGMLAIPVSSEFNITKLSKLDTPPHWVGSILAVDSQPCPRSCLKGCDVHTALLENFLQMTQHYEPCVESHTLPILFHVLVHTLVSFQSSHIHQQQCPIRSYNTVFPTCLESYRNHKLIIPKKGLDRFGDDGTVLLPQKVFSMTSLYNKENDFPYIVHQFISPNDVDAFLLYLWQLIAQVHSSPRLVRKGDIDPDSIVRKSQHTILYPSPPLYCPPNHEREPENSVGWITITEQGIRQSFDLTKVMFSRGNISEKIRFGKLVQKGEVVLDLYAGIGYFTLPAVIIGAAQHVYACEWNPDAMHALRYNVVQNHIQDKVTLYQGDSKLFLQWFYNTSSHAQTTTAEKIKTSNNVDDWLQGDLVDRVSLGLLPSSEDGWPVAVQALKRDTGGWLHIHGNIHERNHESWALHVCKSISEIASRVPWKGLSAMGSPFVLCHHIECVKAFAPHVNHYVLDIFCGPRLPCLECIDGKAIQWDYDHSFTPACNL